MLEDFDPKDFETRTGSDNSVYVKFFTKPVKDDSASDAAGRPIFKDREYVEIRTPGQQTNVVQRPVTDMDRSRFRQAYAMFKSGQDDQLVGTPLEEAPWITRSQVEELAYLRVRTVEHLAELNDSVCGQNAGMYELKRKAQAFIANAKDGAPAAALAAAKEEFANEIETLKRTIEEQSKIIANLKAASSK